MNANNIIVNHLSDVIMSAIQQKEVTYKGGKFSAAELSTADPAPVWNGKSQEPVTVSIDGLSVYNAPLCKSITNIVTYGGGDIQFQFPVSIRRKVKEAATEVVETPIMKQYNDLKKKHPDALLLFRCGNFYESYEDDAEEASKILGITLTRSTKTHVRMAGFPCYALDEYLPKLIRAGKRVAICDQIEKPKEEPKRVTEVVSTEPAKEEPKVEPAKPKTAEPDEPLYTLTDEELTKAKHWIEKVKGKKDSKVWIDGDEGNLIIRIKMDETHKKKLIMGECKYDFVIEYNGTDKFIKNIADWDGKVYK